MAWWGRRKNDPPTVQPSELSKLPVSNVPPDQKMSNANWITTQATHGSNVINFPNQKMSDANRTAVHALLDKLLDEIGPSEYLVMGIEEPDE